MEQAENKSTYGGRKIRIEGHDDVKEDRGLPKEKPQPGYTTLGEAASKGLLKTGMAVVFKGFNFKPIDLTEEMTGKKQQVTCEFSKGVVVKDGKSQFAILCELRFASPNRLVCKGRYGRANIFSTIKNIITRESKKFRLPIVEILSYQDFMRLLTSSYLVYDYRLKEMTGEVIVFDHREYGFLAGVYHNKAHDLYIGPGKETVITNIAILIRGDNIGCYIKKGSIKKITQLHTYSESPYDSYVEIRGDI